MSKMILKEEQQERTLLSFTEQVRSLTEENTSFRDQLKKFGHLHDEIPELNTNIAVLQQTLQKVERERDDFKSTLETTQAQVYTCTLRTFTLYIHVPTCTVCVKGHTCIYMAPKLSVL